MHTLPKCGVLFLLKKVIKFYKKLLTISGECGIIQLQEENS